MLSALILNCKCIVAKKESFINLLDVYHPDVVFGSECCLKPCIVSSEVFPSGYIVYCKDRVDGYGGVFIACRSTLNSNKLTFADSSSELVACKIQLADRSSLIACSIYSPPSSSDSYLEDSSNQLNQIHLDHPSSALWIGGDINLPDINWSNSSVSGHSYSLRLNHIFLDFLLDNTLTQMVTIPTRGTNILDIFVTDRSSLVEFCDTVDGIGDHEAVLVKSLVTAHLSHPNERTIYLWSKQISRILETELACCVRNLFPLTLHLHLLKSFGPIMQVFVILV